MNQPNTLRRMEESYYEESKFNSPQFEREGELNWIARIVDND
jgi:hypothetical protein